MVECDEESLKRNGSHDWVSFSYLHPFHTRCGATDKGYVYEFISQISVTKSFRKFLLSSYVCVVKKTSVFIHLTMFHTKLRKKMNKRFSSGRIQVLFISAQSDSTHDSRMEDEFLSTNLSQLQYRLQIVFINFPQLYSLCFHKDQGEAFNV